MTHSPRCPLTIIRSAFQKQVIRLRLIIQTHCMLSSSRPETIWQTQPATTTTQKYPSGLQSPRELAIIISETDHSDTEPNEGPELDDNITGSRNGCTQAVGFYADDQMLSMRERC